MGSDIFCSGGVDVVKDGGVWHGKLDWEAVVEWAYQAREAQVCLLQDELEVKCKLLIEQISLSYCLKEKSAHSHGLMLLFIITS